jgi:hypothetical protein
VKCRTAELRNPKPELNPRESKLVAVARPLAQAEHENQKLSVGKKSGTLGSKGILRGQRALVLRIKIKLNSVKRKSRSFCTDGRQGVNAKSNVQKLEQHQPMEALRFECRTKQQGLISPFNSNWIHAPTERANWSEETWKIDRELQMDWKKNLSPAERLPVARTRSRLTGSGANNRTIGGEAAATQETRHKPWLAHLSAYRKREEKELGAENLILDWWQLRMNQFKQQKTKPKISAAKMNYRKESTPRSRTTENRKLNLTKQDTE